MLGAVDVNADAVVGSLGAVDVISSIVLKGQRSRFEASRTEVQQAELETTALVISSGERARNPMCPLLAAPALQERRQRHLAAVLVLVRWRGGCPP